MPYCPKCGAKNPDENLFCIECGAELPKVKVPAQARAEEKPAEKPMEVKPEKPVEKVVVKKKGGIGAGGAIVIVFIIGILFVSAFVDLITCPTCRDIPVVRELCSRCGGDGKITVLQYIMYQLEGGFKALIVPSGS